MRGPTAKVRPRGQRQQRLLAQDRRKRRVAETGGEHLRVRGEHLLDDVRVGDDDDRSEAVWASGEDVAVPALSPLQQRQRACCPDRRLEPTRQARAGWKHLVIHI